MGECDRACVTPKASFDNGSAFSDPRTHLSIACH